MLHWKHSTTFLFILVHLNLLLYCVCTVREKYHKYSAFVQNVMVTILSDVKNSYTQKCSSKKKNNNLDRSGYYSANGPPLKYCYGILKLFEISIQFLYFLDNSI